MFHPQGIAKFSLSNLSVCGMTYYEISIESEDIQNLSRSDLEYCTSQLYLLLMQLWLDLRHSLYAQMFLSISYYVLPRYVHHHLIVHLLKSMKSVICSRGSNTSLCESGGEILQKVIWNP